MCKYINGKGLGVRIYRVGTRGGNKRVEVKKGMCINIYNGY